IGRARMLDGCAGPGHSARLFFRPDLAWQCALHNMTKASKTKKLSFPRIYGESARAVPGSGNLSATSCNRAEAAPTEKPPSLARLDGFLANTCRRSGRFSALLQRRVLLPGPTYS